MSWRVSQRWLAVLRRIEAGGIAIEAKDLTAPSPFAAETINARPYAFLDDAPLEERRARAVQSRRFTDPDKIKRDVPRYFNPVERRADIVKYIRANGPVTISDLCEWTGADIGTVGSDVRTLKREGRIVWAGWDRIPSGGKQKLWRLADAEQT